MPTAPSSPSARRLADPGRCPDCAAALPRPPVSCPACALPLTGPVAAELFATLQAADRLLGRLRTERTERTAVPAGPAPAAPLPETAARRRSWLSAATVPRVLLGLGALCLLVASLVFLAVAWTLLGVGGRTAVLLVGTVAAATGCALAHRRRLPAAAESLAVVAAGLLVLDVLGAHSAGWWGATGAGGLGLVVGLLLLGSGAVATLASRRVAGAPALVAPELAAVAGAVVAAVAGTTLGADPAPPLMVAGLALAVVAGLAHHARLPLLRDGVAAAAALWWAGLVLLGVERLLPDPSVAGLWAHGDAWPLVVAALGAGAVAAARRLPDPARLVAAGLAVLPATLALLLPAADGTLAEVVGATTAAAAVLAAASLTLPRRWAAAPLGALAPTLLGPVVGAALVAVHAAATVLSVGPAWSRGPGVALDPAGSPLPPLLLLPATAAVALGVAALLRLTRSGSWVAAPVRPTAATLVALACLAVLASYAVPLALVVGGLLVLAGAVLMAGHRDPRPGAPSLGAAVLGAVLVAALPSAWLTGVVLLAGVAACLTRWSAVGVVGRGARTLLPPALAGLVWTLGEVAGVDPALRGVPVLLALAAVALVRPRAEVEAAALLAGGAATALAVGATPATDQLTSIAVHLTVAGALVTSSALVHGHRRALGWLGGGLLAAATWARLVELGVVDPEAYTLPSALALLAVGLVRMGRDRAVGTARALTPGLVLATVPTLLVALVDPVSWRAVALGAACLALVLAGAGLRWAAPVVVGAVVGGLLVLREAAPYAAVVPQWILIGVAGALLTAAGVTWEQRVRDVRAAGSLLAALR